jgi:hypothetical protein
VAQESKHFGYMVDLTGLQFADGANGSPTSWIQCMPLGTYEHPFFGEIDFTPEKLKQFAASVHNQVRGTELDIDYDHKMNSGEAAGWVKDAEVRESEGLWILVEWTKTAAEKIKEKAYKYFSPEFADKWKHPKTGAIYENVLFGGGITNRPFLKDILPLNLSELVQESGGTVVINQADKSFTYSESGNSGNSGGAHLTFATTANNPTTTNTSHQGGGNKMATKKFSQLSLTEVQALAKTLGLSDDAPVSDVEKALNELVGATGTTPPAPPAGGGGAPAPAPVVDEVQQRLASGGRLDERMMADISALVADNPANKVLAEVIEQQYMELAHTGQALRFAEAQGRITKLQEIAIQQKLAFPAAIQDDLRDVLIDAPKEFSEKIYKVFEKLAKTGMVRMGELGRSYRGDFGQTAKLTIDERARQMMSREPGLQYGDAVVRVTRDDPKVFDDYRADVMELD